MKRLRGVLVWLLLFAAGVFLGRKFFPRKTALQESQESVVPVQRQGTARIAPLSEAEKLLRGGGAPESLQELESVPVPETQEPSNSTSEDG